MNIAELLDALRNKKGISVTLEQGTRPDGTAYEQVTFTPLTPDEPRGRRGRDDSVSVAFQQEDWQMDAPPRPRHGDARRTGQTTGDVWNDNTGWKSVSWPVVERFGADYALNYSGANSHDDNSLAGAYR